MNGTHDGCTFHTPYVTRSNGLYIATELLIAVLAVTGNSLVCLAVFHKKKLRTVTNYFLVSLAVADTLVGLVAIPCAMLTDLGQPRHDLNLCKVLLSVLIVLTQSSMLSMLAVAVERYMAILLPFQYQRVMSPRNAQLALLLTWVMAAIFGTVPLMGPEKQPANSSYCIFPCVVDMTSMVYFNTCCCFLLPLLAMFLIYGHIFHTICRQIRRIAVTSGAAAGVTDAGSGSTRTEDVRSSCSGGAAAGGAGKASGGGIVETRVTTAGPAGSCGPRDPRPSESAKARSHTRSAHELRKATSLFLVLFLYMVCWMPIHLINMVMLFCTHCTVQFPVSLAAILLSHANSALNPILYAYRMRSFQRALTEMWRGLWSGARTPK